MLEGIFFSISSLIILIYLFIALIAFILGLSNKDNDYYKQYERYHDELKAGKRDKVTVEDIGGLECQKCHY